MVLNDGYNTVYFSLINITECCFFVTPGAERIDDCNRTENLHVLSKGKRHESKSH
jgi:hypothetical protein